MPKALFAAGIALIAAGCSASGGTGTSGGGSSGGTGSGGDAGTDGDTAGGDAGYDGGSGGDAGPSAWTDLGPHTNITSNNPCVANDFDGIAFAFHDNCDAIISAWGGGAWDDTRQLLYLNGGGHDVSIDDSVLALDPIHSTITKVWGPASDVSPTTPQPQETPTTHQPVSVHVYSGMLYFPTSQKLWRYGGNDYGAPAQYAFVFEMDMTNPSAGWTALPSAHQAAGTVAGAYCVVDPTTSDETAVCTFPYGSYDFSRWDRQTSAWTTLCTDCVVGTDYAGHTVPGAAAIGSATMDPGTQRIWYFAGAGQGTSGAIYMYDTSSTSSVPVEVTPQSGGCGTVLGPGSYAYPGVAWDPTVNQIRVYSSAGDAVTTFDPVTLTCTDQTISGGPAPDPSESASNNGIGSRFRYAPSLNSFIAMPGGTLDGYTLSLR